jgi:multiple sugar transport system permease protein
MTSTNIRTGAAGSEMARIPVPASRLARRRWTRATRLTVLYVLVIAGAAVFIFPYVLVLFAAMKPLNSLFTEAPWVPPSHVTFTYFREVLVQDDFLRFLANTAGVAVIITVGQVVSSVMAAYAFARLEFPGREAIFWVYLTTLMVPNVVTIIPLFVIMRQFHLLNTYMALFLPYVFGTPYTIFLVRQFFLTIPRELFDSARIDGCSEFRVLTRIAVPLARPIITTVAVIAFVFGWNNFLWPLISTNSNGLRVLTVGVAALQSNLGTQWNLLMAGAMITLAPLLILFAIFQRQIVRSIQMTGGLK